MLTLRSDIIPYYIPFVLLNFAVIVTYKEVTQRSSHE